MKSKLIVKEEFLDNRNNAPLPRPIPTRECQCGCGHRFQPKRNDNIYLNKQHADFAYNHGPRKQRNTGRIEFEKILRKNDNILHKYFTSIGVGTEREQYYEVLKADGFKSGYHIGRINVKEKEYHLVYRYMYHVLKRENIFRIIIMKA
ncbi:MAG: hypothetical protein ACI86C_001702 [Candidatus Latescibacterota bacterium]|jgi:hypothetical protein